MINYFILIKNFLSSYFVVPLVLIVGIYFSIRLRFLQFTKLSYGIKALMTNKTSKKGVSSFAALAAVLGGNLGTGNIAGIAFGITVGGPGSLFWMWIMALLGAVVKYVGCFLGVLYRTKDLKIEGEGGNIGGPMFYLEKGMKLPKIAKLFCIFCILGAFTVGNLVQVNSITLPLNNLGISPLTSGIFMAVCVGIVLFGGKRRFLSIATKIVPLMAIVYILSCLIIISLNFSNIIPAFKIIFNYALNPYAIAGGAGGYFIFDAIRVGFDRGLFATDAGIGLAPILHAEVTGKESLEKTAFTQGMVSIVAPIIVMIICTITGLTLLVTGVWQDNALESTNMCIKAFQEGFGFKWAGSIVLITLWFFAFTTILTWAHCSEKAFNFLLPKVAPLFYRILFILIVPIGALTSVAIVWFLADITINLMLLINLIGVVGLGSIVIKETKKFF